MGNQITAHNQHKEFMRTRQRRKMLMKINREGSWEKFPGFLLTTRTWTNHIKPMMENSLLKLLNMDWIKKRTYCKSCSGRRTRDKHTFPSLTFEVTLSPSPMDSLSKSKIQINSIFKYRDSSCVKFPFKPTYHYILQLFSPITFIISVLVMECMH